MSKFLSIIIVAFSASLLYADSSFHDSHVLFENSAAEDSYSYSTSYSLAPSTCEQSDGKCPVDTENFISPGNALRITWKSIQGGDWQVSIKMPLRLGPELETKGNTLSIWCLAPQGLKASESPILRILDRKGANLPDTPLLKAGVDLPAGQWTRLSFHLPDFGGMYQSTTDSRFNSRQIGSIVICQRLDDGHEHTLFVDDIFVADEDQFAPHQLQAPTNLSVEGQDSHCELSWNPCEDSNVLSYRVYRSWDGKEFIPILTRPADCPRCVDYVGQDKKAMYKVSAVDIANHESPLSSSVAGETRAFSDDELLDMVQRSCFKYYWEGAHPNAGMALEATPGDKDLVALGGSGFGVSALVVATERGFITREQAVERLLKILAFLEKADRFHGVWPHFLDGRTGKAWPLFGKYDNGADLVETAFMMQGLLTAKQYFSEDNPQEEQIRNTISRFWQEVEWDWFRKTPDGEVLFWHWSPDYGWHISHPLIGWNETMIVYLLGIASPTHAIPASLYYTGWAGQSEYAADYRHGWSRTTDGDHYANGHTYYGHKLDVGCGTGGDLFFAQFSFLGFDPRGIKDKYTNYFHNNRQLALINRGYCIANPNKRKGYGPNCWGLSAGVNTGGGKPQPKDDNGTICASAALGVMPYTPTESMAALEHFYRNLGQKTWGVYGFHDGFNETTDWYDECYMGLNQAQIVVGIENHRTGLCWRNFMANPEIKPALDKIGFEKDLTTVSP
jgi:hypothetical protein